MDSTVKFAQSRAPRVLLLGFDGGIGQAALMTDHELQLCVVDSFARAEWELSRFGPDAVVIAFADPPFEQVAELRQLRQKSTAPLLVMSRPVNEQRVTELIKAGAGGYLFVSDA